MCSRFSMLLSLKGHNGGYIGKESQSSKYVNGDETMHNLFKKTEYSIGTVVSETSRGKNVKRKVAPTR